MLTEVKKYHTRESLEEINKISVPDTLVGMINQITALISEANGFFKPKTGDFVNVINKATGRIKNATIERITNGVVSLEIWAVNREVVDKALKSYPNERCEIKINDAKFFLEDKEFYTGLFKSIPLNDGELLTCGFDDGFDFFLMINISRVGEERLMKEIKALMKEHNIQEECIDMNRYGYLVGNPNT